MIARSIGEILAPIVARAERMRALQALLNEVRTADGRKWLIMGAFEQGAIDDQDARLLLEVYQLETA